jgi:ParB/RepB/Spo0J family partition protein
MAELMNLKPSQLVLAAYNPRKTFDHDSLNELAESLKSQGMLQPVLVRLFSPAKGRKPATYEVVCGARRTKAAELAGLELVPCNVAELTDDQAIEAAITENLQRQDVHPMEEARAFAALLERGYTLQQLGERFGKSHVHIWNRVQLAKATPELQEAIEAGKIPLTYARELAKFPEHVQVEEVEDKGWAYNRDPKQYFEKVMNHYSVDLNDAPFRLSDVGCSDCPFSSDAMGFTSFELRCLNKSKYQAHVMEHVLAMSAEDPELKFVAFFHSHEKAVQLWQNRLPENRIILKLGWQYTFDFVQKPEMPVFEEPDADDYDTTEAYELAVRDAKLEHNLEVGQYLCDMDEYNQKLAAGPRGIFMCDSRMGHVVPLQENLHSVASKYNELELLDGADENAGARAELSKEIIELAEQIKRNPILASEKAYEVAREQINDLAMYKGIDSIEDQPALLDEEMDALYLHMVTERISFFPDNVRRAIMGKPYETFRFTPKQIEAALAVKKQLWPLAVRMFLKQSFQHVNGSSCSTQERYAWDKIALALPDVDYSEVAKVHDGYAAKLKKLQDRYAELVASLEKLKEVAQ